MKNIFTFLMAFFIFPAYLHKPNARLKSYFQ